jgi:hypothetical protein
MTELEIYGEHFQNCLNRFDQFLDQVEEIIEKWTDYHGIDTTSIQ